MTFNDATTMFSFSVATIIAIGIIVIYCDKLKDSDLINIFLVMIIIILMCGFPLSGFIIGLHWMIYPK